MGATRLQRLLVDDGWVDLATGDVVREGGASRLTGKELAVLRFLAERPGRAVTLDELHTEVWGHSPQVVSRAAYHTIARLRAKVERDPREPTRLVNHYADGYTWRAGAPLVGRGGWLVAFSARLAGQRVVALTGPAGVGKTALVRAALPDAVMCDLEGVRERDEAIFRVALALGIDAAVVDGPAMAHVLACCTTAVVLDHADAVGELVDGWTARWVEGPGPPLVVTSRRRVITHAEPVSVPPLSAGAALALVSLRAGAAAAEGGLGGDALEQARDLAERSGGVPLAIELAVGRLGAVDDPVEAGHAESALDEALDASWRVLAPAEREQLVAVAAFRGPVAARTIARMAHDPGPVLDRLQALTTAGWLTRTEGDGAVSLVLAPAARAFAAGQGSAADQVDTALAHARVVADDVDRVGPVDLRRATDTALARGPGGLAARLVVALHDRARRHVPTTTWRSLFTALEACAGVDAGLAAQVALRRAAWLASRGARAEAMTIVVGVAGSAAAPAARARAHGLRGRWLLAEGADDDGRRALDDAERLWDALEAPDEVAALQLERGCWLLDRGDPDQAATVLEAIGEVRPRLRLRIVERLGVAYLGSGRPALAEARLVEALRLATDLAEPDEVATVRLRLATLALATGDRDGAASHARAARRGDRRSGRVDRLPGIDALLAAAAEP